MKTLLKTMAFIAALSLNTSCYNEKIEDLFSVTEVRTNDKEFFIFKYQGVEYATEYYLADTTRVYTDPNVAEIISKLESNPNVSTLTYPNGMIEYFDSSKELETFIEKKEKSNSNTAQTRLSIVLLTSIKLEVYEHINFEGEVLTYNNAIEVPDMRNAYNNPDLVTIRKNFNDKISSFRLTGSRSKVANFFPKNFALSAIVLFYQDINYEGGIRGFVLDIDHEQISHHNFRKIKFNDKVSSFKLYTVTDAYPRI